MLTFAPEIIKITTTESQPEQVPRAWASNYDNFKHYTFTLQDLLGRVHTGYR